MIAEASEQYSRALRAGQKYYRGAVSRGEYPYLPALDEILSSADVAGYSDLGLIDVPAELIAGTRTVGRVAALAGNFMPLLPPESEFGGKWIHLCDAHLGDEGIRDPVKCWEYMGRFYVEEGNKRVSVLKSYDSPTIPAHVTRVVPRWSQDHDVQLYYEFMDFYNLSGMYGIKFRHRGGFAKLQAALGVDPDHVWTQEERRSFSAGFARFLTAYRKVDGGREEVTPAEALIIWLQVFSFGDIKTQTPGELVKNLSGIWPDVTAQAQAADETIELSVQPEEKENGLLSRILGAARPDHIRIAFIYGFAPEKSAWTLAHDGGRAYLEQHMANQVSVSVYTARDRDYFQAMETAVAEGAELIFATTPSMIADCRRCAALHPQVRILNCGLFQPYTGVRMYYSRIHECKFITGAIAGAMAETDTVGYVANYPIFGTPASINAFALGVRLTNPRARVRVAWSCCEGDPVRELLDSGADVISNRDAVRSGHSFELGTYKYLPDGRSVPLAAPLMYWGEMYERIVLSIFSGAWADMDAHRAINYWWGMDSGVLDVTLNAALPDGVFSLGRILKNGITDRSIDLFRTRITDRDGVLRNDGSRSFTPEELIAMDWFCDNVDAQIPGFRELIPAARATVRLLGLYRRELEPEKEAAQL